METGTGKTYVYLRTLFELNARYGWKKFIIVVPSVAIREGVLNTIELTKEHFQSLYGNAPLDYWVYDSAQVSKLRQFSASNLLSPAKASKSSQRNCRMKWRRSATSISRGEF
jgi:type III restriction enzyme